MLDYVRPHHQSRIKNHESHLTMLDLLITLTTISLIDMNHLYGQCRTRPLSRSVEDAAGSQSPCRKPATEPHIDFKECVRCDICEIQLIERTGV